MSLSQALYDFVAWLLDPTTMIAAGFKLMGKLFELVGWMMGGDLGAQFSAAGGQVADVPIAKLYSVTLYMCSPIVNPTLLTACIGIVLDIWLITRIVRIIVYIASWIWPNPT